MAELVSPGVSISVSDESFYAAAGTGTVPMILLATAEGKTAPDGSSTAAYTTSAEAGEVKLITSQRELLTQYGNPKFYTSGGTPLHGHELNEYGLMAAYSFLGIANRAYVLRADINLSQLESRSSAPTTPPADGSYWLDTSTVWGLKRYNGSNWERQTVLVALPNETNGSNEPKASLGTDGSFAAVYFTAAGATQSTISIYEKIDGAWYLIGSSGWDTASGSRDFQIAAHTNVPTVKSTSGALATGDLYLQTNAPNNGTTMLLKLYDATTQQFTTQVVSGHEYSYQAYTAYSESPSEGDIWVDYSSDVASVSIKRHNGNDIVTALSSAALSDTVLSTTPHTAGTIAFKVAVNDRDVVNGASGYINVSLNGYDGDADGNLSVDDVVEAFQAALSAADDTLTLADTLTVSNAAGKIAVVSNSGYDIKFEAGNVAGFDPTDLNLLDSTTYTNFESLSFESSSSQITGDLAEGTLWYDSLLSDDNIDILYNNAGTWATYPGDVNISASEPTLQSDNESALVEDDLWISSADLENYPLIYKWSGSAWVAVDTTDQVSEDGIVFGDFRASSASSIDADAPSAEEYPINILAWNKRASGGNVKEWKPDYTVGGTNIGDRWVDYSGNKDDGSPYLLRKAQRRAVVRGLQAAITSSTEAVNETNRFNLIAAPGYPELIDEMIELQTNRKETAFVVGDAPFRLSADSTSTQAWATNANNAGSTGEDGLSSSSPYVGVYYPHGKTSNLDGTDVVVPGSHIALRTLAFNDQVAFPWFAPAGFQRGLVTNATSVGYINATSGEFTPVSLSEGQRDSLYINKINPIGNFPGRGLAIFGQKTLNPVSSALDRVNVARLVIYIRERLDDIVKPFLFEPNDDTTRQNAKVVVDRFLGNLVTQRGLYDFVTVCDTSNNTPERIDRNELHIDVAIQPVKAVEFIYIPIRVQNTLGSTG